MDAIDLLTQDHRSIEDLFDRIDVTDRPDEKEDLLEELAHALTLHTVLEEQHLYPAARARGEEEAVRAYFEDHARVKQRLARLLDLDGDDEEFDDEVRALYRVVEQHVAEEERELFPHLRRAFNADDLAELAGELRATRAALTEMEPREFVSTDETAAP